MISYIFIKDLFQTILSQSHAIQGRFHIAHRYGAQEINSDQLGEVLKEITTTQKYPLSVLVPPTSRGNFGRDPMWERYRIIIFFMKSTYYGAGNATNPQTRTSIHSVEEDWHDMKRVANNFLKQLENVQRTTKNSVFRVPTNTNIFYPVSILGQDRVSGIKLDFDLDIFQACELEDYDTLIDNPEIPLDSHPEHL